MSDNDPLQRARAAALRLLAHRPRTEAEVRSRLLRHHSPSIVDQVVLYLKERGLVDDVSFASLWRDSRDSLKPRSATAIRRELVTKGVDRGVADEVAGHVDDEDSAYRAGLAFVRRLKGVDLITFRRRLWGHLQRRGFGSAVSRRTISRLWEERGDEEPQGGQTDC